MPVHYPFTAPIIIPLVKNLWKMGYTRRIGVTTTIVTVIRMDVAVEACARLAAIASAEEELFTSAFKELA